MIIALGWCIHPKILPFLLYKVNRMCFLRFFVVVWSTGNYSGGNRWETRQQNDHKSAQFSNSNLEKLGRKIRRKRKVAKSFKSNYESYVTRLTYTVRVVDYGAADHAEWFQMYVNISKVMNRPTLPDAERRWKTLKEAERRWKSAVVMILLRRQTNKVMTQQWGAIENGVPRRFVSELRLFGRSNNFCSHYDAPEQEGNRIE